MRDRYNHNHAELVARTYLACYQNSHDMSDEDKEAYVKAQEEIEKAQEVLSTISFKNRVGLDSFYNRKQVLAGNVETYDAKPIKDNKDIKVVVTGGK